MNGKRYKKPLLPVKPVEEEAVGFPLIYLEINTKGLS
jgi:hypothetical protein